MDAIKVEESLGWKKMVWAWVDGPKGLICAGTLLARDIRLEAAIEPADGIALYY